MTKYPDGKIDKTDAGEVQIACYLKQGRLILDFGKDTTWLGFDKQSLRAFIDGLEAQYKKL